MAKGDTIRVILRDVVPETITARQNGRQLEMNTEKDSGISWTVIEEKTRGGTVVRTSRFRTDEVIAVHFEKVESG